MPDGDSRHGLRPVESVARAARTDGPVKAFCIDFNWGPSGVAPPGMYAHADPAEHVRWYHEFGVNVIQTFCVTYNGYAWYPSRVAPITPGLRAPEFVNDVVRLGRRVGLRVFGYFCLGSNPWWEQRNPDLVHSDAHGIRIPFTLEYLDYFCRVVEDALLRTDVEGFMIDWIRPVRRKRWLEAEKRMYAQLMGEAFPTAGEPPAPALLEFERRAIDRAWRYIRWTVRATRPAIIWTNHPILREEYPIWEDSRLLREVDWVLNEAPELEHVAWLRQRVGPQTLIVQNLCGWQGHDAEAWRKLDLTAVGLYGFAKADEKTTLVDLSVPHNARNVEILRAAYRAI